MSQTNNKNNQEGKSKGKDRSGESGFHQSGLDLSKLTPEKYGRLLDYLERSKRGEDVSNFVLDYPKTKDEAKTWDYKYWSKRSIPKLGEAQATVNIIDQDLKSKLVTQVKMFSPYSWIEIDLSNDKQVDDICTFLNKNYKLDKGDNFRLYYTKEYIRWSLGPKCKMIGIHCNGIIGGIIAASIKICKIFEKGLQVADINYLCIHPKLRGKGLAQMFIDEITRNMCNDNIVVGSFTTQRYIPTPICKTEFYHRPLNYEKLYNANFIRLESNISLDKGVSTFMIQYKHKHKVVRMGADHYDEVYELLCKYQDKYNFYQEYSREEFEHYFKNSNIVSSYVILNDSGDILDFYSYYKLPYYVVGSEKGNKVAGYINAVYMHMYTSSSVTQLTIFKSAVLCAYEEGNDVLNCTDIMENIDILFDNFSKFCKGGGYLYYNFYNLTCPQVSPQQICKITL